MIECTNFEQINKGSLVGYADIYIDKWACKICGFALFEKNGKRWVNPPQRKKGEAWVNIIQIADPANHEIFINEVKLAINTYLSKENRGNVEQTLDEEIPF